MSFLIGLLILSLAAMSRGAWDMAVVSSSISAGASLVGTTISTLSEAGSSRNIVIEISNHLEIPLYGGSHFLRRGKNTVPPPSVIQMRTREITKFEKYIRGTTSGTAGILLYTVDDDSNPVSFVIVFSVPFNYFHADNWFGLLFVEEGREMDIDLYDELYHHGGWKNPWLWNKHERLAYAHHGKPVVISRNNYVISASMSSAGRCVMKVDVNKRTGAYEHIHRKFRG